MDVLWEDADVEIISQERGEINSTSRRGNGGDMREKGNEISAIGVLNPTACLHLGDVILFTVGTRHYPQYDL